MFKKGQIKSNTVGLILIILVAFMVFKDGGFGSQATGGGTGGASDPIEIEVKGGCNVEDTTVTFSHVDLYSQGTSVSQGARGLMFDNEINFQVANAGTKSFSPGNSYKVLLGNLTSALTANTDYYPQYIEGTLDCKGTETLLGKLPKTTQISEMSITYWNNNDEANTVQALGANDEETVKFRLQVADNECFGNPYAADMGGKNVLCLGYNTTVISSVELDGATPASKPKSATADSGKDLVCYEWPVICDNEDYTGNVIITTGSTEPAAQTGTQTHNISISLHDVTFDFNADTLDLIVGVEDELKTRNDIGITDLNLGDEHVFSIGIS